MIILGIETSCDETAAAVLEQDPNGQIKILSNIIASSSELQSKYGGIIPEQAAREQLKSIIPVIKEALTQAFPAFISSSSSLTRGSINIPPIDAIAVTYGPGLISSLLVGVETAKVLSMIWNKPLIPVNHLLGHFYANWISSESSFSSPIKTIDQAENEKRRAVPDFPCIGLLVSGGHTDLVLFKDHQKYQYLGGTRDDAAGECFDKCARLLNLPYPGGPEISKLAENGDPKAFDLPRPMINTQDFDFSYSGLKTAVASLVKSESAFFSPIKTVSQDKKVRATQILPNLCASIEQAIIDPLVKKTIKAAVQYKVKTIILGGGVAANDKLQTELDLNAKRYLLDAKIFVPQKSLSTDNAAMIASRAFFEKPTPNPFNLQANPNLSL